MEITSSTGVTPSSAAATPAGTRVEQRDAGDALANKETFLQLLVAQVRNQDPLNPADGIEFLSQLAQFSELEQLIGIRSELRDLAAKSISADDGSQSDPAA